jgi:hypothetical protein
MTSSPVKALLADLAARGIELQVRGGRLLFRPQRALGPDLAGRLKTHKDELLTHLLPPTAPLPAWDPAAADRLLSDLRAYVAMVEANFRGRTPAPLAAVLADALALGEGYVANRDMEARRGWDALALLRDLGPCIRRWVGNWGRAGRERDSH